MFCFPSSHFTVWQHMKEALSRMSESRCWETQMFPVLRIMGELIPPALNSFAQNTLECNAALIQHPAGSIQGLAGWRMVSGRCFES